MGVRNRLSFHRWNIGFIESSTVEIAKSDGRHVNWVKHDYRDRFFADPFILAHDEKRIKVLVEEYPFITRRGVISILDVDRQSYKLLDKHVLIEMDYHQSYPFILRHEGKIYIMPEASQSGSLWAYEFDGENILGRKLVIDEPLLDSTIYRHGNKWWLFCTKRGADSNRDLFIYSSDQPLSDYRPLSVAPVKSDLSSSRPAGYMFENDGNIFRVTQDCSKTYGGGVNLTQVSALGEDTFKEDIVKPVKADLSEFNEGFHTINEYKGLTVLDGIKSEFRPITKIVSTICSKFRK